MIEFISVKSTILCGFKAISEFRKQEKVRISKLNKAAANSHVMLAKLPKSDDDYTS